MAKTSDSKPEVVGSSPTSPAMLIFGSTALQYWYSDIGRIPADLDVITKNKKPIEPKPNVRVEYHWEEGFQYILDNNKNPNYVDPNFLYTIKVTHAAWDVRWDKTMHDIMFMKKKGCVLDETLYFLLLKDNAKRHGEKRVYVKGTSDEFFKMTITRTISHDDLHHLVKFYSEPLHNRIRKDPNDVKTSKSLWDKLSYDDQLKCALEEAYVFAIERYIHMPAKIAFAYALRNLITSSTKGYFNLFLIENFSELLYYKHDHFINLFKEFKNDKTRNY